MMPLAIDPSERRSPTRSAAAPRTRTTASGKAARPIVLAALGCVGLVGLSAGSYAMLSGLAGPQPTKIAIGRIAADMPDLRDGVPALVTSGPADRSAPRPVPAQREAAVNPVRPVAADTPSPVQASRMAVAAQSDGPTKPESPAKIARVLPIQNAALVVPARTAALVPATRVAALVTPSARETVRSRVAPETNTSFAALPPEPVARETPNPRKKAVAANAAPVQPVANPKVAARARPAASRVADATPGPAAAAEPEETEVFGMKVPSLAPAGRKFVEGVQALGEAVKSLPDKF